MRKAIQFTLTTALLVALATPVLAQHPEKPKGPKKRVAVVTVFREPDRGVFREYYRVHRAEVRALPPGIAKQLARGRPLPPGIVRAPVPEVILVRLPPRPSGYEVFLVGDRVVMLDRRGLVVDLFIF
jgi:hypothetical protein